ncbi:MAG: riboflavin biosynthesis protein RibF [Myxococcales bacterium]|nr:riboflavin biosynthesis protein RibF [Myxococcales bacterium]
MRVTPHFAPETPWTNELIRNDGTPEPLAVTIGNFDGVHRGHQVLLARACKAAAELGLTPAALTFEPHPATVFRGVDPSTYRITTSAERAALLQRFGMKHVFTRPFDRTFGLLTAEQFVEEFLLQTLGAKHITVGFDFSFGAGRSGRAADLVRMARQFGFGVEVVELQRIGPDPASSTRVRELLRAGDLQGVNEMLGHRWTLTGHTAHGAGRGQKIGIPTVNLYPENRLLPPFGVYATRIRVAGKCWDAISNLGVRPTFETSTRVSLETMILSPVEQDLHDLPAEVEVIGFVRPEMRFEDAESLKSQIAKDIEATQQLLSNEPT